MELRQIEHFVAVVDHGGFSAAARELYIAQPSLSQSINRLEEDLGERLLDRTPTGVRPTEAGARFLAHARDVVGRLGDLTRTTADLRTARGRRIRVATLGTLAIDPLPDLLSALHGEIPDLEIRIDAARSREGLVTAVRCGAVDAGLTDLARSGPGLSTHAVERQEIVLVAPPGALDGAPVSIADLGKLDMVAPPSDIDDSAPVRHAFRGHHLRVVVECPDWNGVIQAVRHGAGAVLMSRPVAERFFASDQISSTEPRIARDVGIVYRTGDGSPTVAALLDAARSTNDRARGVRSVGSNITT